MIILAADSASELVYRVLGVLSYDDPFSNGQRWDVVGPRGQATREMRHCDYVLRDVTRCAAWLRGRELNYPFMVAEWLWIFCGRDDVEMIGFYNEKIREYSDDGESFFGAYGPRWRSQIAGAVERLKADRDSRQAVVSLWRPEYQYKYERSDKSLMVTKDVPCTLSMQYLVRDGRLESDVCMRSSDAWLGLPYDLFNFAMLQRCVAAALEIQAGDLVLHVGSSHLYERDRERANRLVHASYDAMFMQELEVPAPLGLGFQYIVEAEEDLRRGYLRGDDDFTSVGWAPFLSMLAYRRHQDPQRVHESLRPLLVRS